MKELAIALVIASAMLTQPALAADKIKLAKLVTHLYSNSTTCVVVLPVLPRAEWDPLQVSELPECTD